MSPVKIDLLTGKDLIVFGEDFGRHAHSLEHLLRPLFKDNRFIWVETIGLRSPKFSFYDLKRIAGKLRGWFGTTPQKIHRETPSTVKVVSPFMIPFNQYSWVRKFNRWSVQRTVGKAQKELSFSNVITVSSVPNAADYVGDFGEILKVFVCVDEFSLWPGLDYELVNRMEQKILAKSDLIFATSQSLAANKKNGVRPTVLLTHGVDFNHFNIGPKKEFSRPIKLCYFGLFDERSDQHLLQELVGQLPDCEIHIIGNVVCDISALKKYSQFVFHGPVPYARLPQAIFDMDVFLLPYLRNKLTENINPLKLKEYLSTGRPVIATPLPEVLALQEHLFVGTTGLDFVSVIEKLQSHSLQYQHECTLNYLQENETWESKAQLFSDEVLGSLKA